MKLPKFEKAIADRGRRYFKEGRVKNMITKEKDIRATVVGSRNYRVHINLETGKHKCTCPYDWDCKHMFAVIQAHRSGKGVTSMESIERGLRKKSKDELKEVIMKMLRLEPRLASCLTQESPHSAIEKPHANHDDDCDALVEEVDTLLERILESKKKLENLLFLFRKCFGIYEEYGGIEPLEDSMFDILNAISKEAKRLSPRKRQATLQEIVDMTKDFDFFWDSIDDEGVKVKYPAYYRK